MNFFKTALKNWRSTLAGVAALATAATQIAHNPAALLDAQTLGLVASGLGLIVAADPAKLSPAGPRE